MKITLGSKSAIKIAAVKDACRKLGIPPKILGVETCSHQDAQPISLVATFAGASARAQQARDVDPKSLAIGIESGLCCLDLPNNIFVDLAVIVAITSGGRKIISTSNGLQFPGDCVQLAAEKGFSGTTAGSIIASKFGGIAGDPHWSLTGGKLSRADTLVTGLIAIFRQL